MRTVRLAVALAVLLLAPAASARVVRIEVLSRTPVLDGKPFGAAGAYEKIAGRVHFKVRPDHPRNRDIVDLDRAPRDSRGEVDFSADVFILRPRDPRRGNGALLLEIPNRGRKGILAIVNGGTGSPDPTAASDFGDGWLMRQGYTLVTIGWQWDVGEDPTRMRLHAPVARNADGSKITGLLRNDFSLPEKRSEIPLGHIIVGDIGGAEYPVANPGDPRNVLTVRDRVAGPRRKIPRSRWSFSRTVEGKPETSDRHLTMESGFLPGKIYELVYTVEDPVVAGLSLAAVRDLVSHIKYDPRALVRARRAHAAGISQCGRFLRHFVWAGFNQDESGRQVLDGVLAHVAGAGRGSFNHRFAQPSRDSQPRNALFYPTDLYPFTDLPQRDTVTRERAGILDRAYAAKVDPKIFYSNTSYEYWGRAAALIHTSPDGERDAPIPDNVRIYTFSGLQHFSRPFPPEHGTGDLKSTHRQNPNPIRWYWRAMIASMDRWVKDGVRPPPSRYPRISDGTLVELDQLRFPKIPGLRVPQKPVRAWRLDLGDRWPTGVISRHPPGVGRPFPLLVAQVDRDGNDRGGIISPQLVVPLATYTPWNLRHPSIGAPGEMVSFLGSYVPLAKTAADRKKSRDPRPSIAERYKNREEYLERFRAATEDLVRARYLLAEDIPALMERGAQEWAEATREAASP